MHASEFVIQQNIVVYSDMKNLMFLVYLHGSKDTCNIYVYVLGETHYKKMITNKMFQFRNVDFIRYYLFIILKNYTRITQVREMNNTLYSFLQGLTQYTRKHYELAIVILIEQKHTTVVVI